MLYITKHCIQFEDMQFDVGLLVGVAYHRDTSCTVTMILSPCLRQLVVCGVMSNDTPVDRCQSASACSNTCSILERRWDGPSFLPQLKEIVYFSDAFYFQLLFES